MTIPSTSPAMLQKRSRFSRFLIWIGVIAGLFIAFTWVSWMLSERWGRQRLEMVIAELDRSDPNWRLEDLDKDATPPPNDRNSALLVKQILTEKPANWPSNEVQQRIGSGNPQERLDPELAKILKAEMARSPQSVAAVRKLADTTRGYDKIVWAPDAISTLLPLVQQSREVAVIAKYDAQARMEERDFDGALESCRAILASGRSTDPVSTLIQMLVRMAIQSICLGEVERTLAQGEPSEVALLAMQRFLEVEEAQSLLSQGLRGERAMSYRVIENTIRPNSIKAVSMSLSGVWSTKATLMAKLWALAQIPFVGTVDSNEAMCLTTLTELLDSLKGPESKQQAAFDRVDAMGADWRQPALFRMLLPAVTKVREAYLRGQARMRTTIVALAAERYRRKQGRWPEKLDDLVPAQLKQIPSDPYDGKPLRMKRLDDGLVIYSVGPDKVDDGGVVTSVTAMTADSGIRLWDVSKRGQKPKPDTPVESVK